MNEMYACIASACWHHLLLYCVVEYRRMFLLISGEERRGDEEVNK
jgi:hypothetical protein